MRIKCAMSKINLDLPQRGGHGKGKGKEGRKGRKKGSEGGRGGGRKREGRRKTLQETISYGHETCCLKVLIFVSKMR